MRKMMVIAVSVFLSLGALSAEGRSKPSKDPNVQIAEGHFRKSRDFFGAKNYDGAIEEINAAIEAWPNPDLYYNKGRYLEEAGRLGEAIKVFEVYRGLIAPDPKQKSELAPLNARLEELGKRIAAQEAEARARALPPSPPPAPPVLESPAALPIVVAAPSPPPPPTKPPFFKQYRGPLLVAGGGLLALAVGTGLAVSSKVSYDDLKSTCSPHCTDEQLAGPKTSGYVGAAFLAAGALAVVGGTVWGIVTWKRHRTPTSPSVTFAPTGSGLVVAGTF